MSRLGINIKQCISLPYAEIGKTASINRLLILSSYLISLSRKSAKHRQHRLSTSVSSSFLSWDQIRQYVLSLWCKPEARAPSRQQIPDLQSTRWLLRQFYHLTLAAMSTSMKLWNYWSWKCDSGISSKAQTFYCTLYQHGSQPSPTGPQSSSSSQTFSVSLCLGVIDLSCFRALSGWAQ